MPQLSEESFTKAKIIDCRVILATEDPFGRVLSGELLLQSIFLSWHDWRGSYKAKAFHGESYHTSDDTTNPLRYSLDEMTTDSLGAMIYTLTEWLQDACILQIARWPVEQSWVTGEIDEGGEELIVCHALLLSPVSDVEGKFTRIGTAELPVRDGLTDDSWDWKEVTII